MTTITHLPDEIIVTILENKNISVEDIVNLKSTCKRLQHTTFSTKFWEKKYFQRFPLSKRIHNEKRLKKIFNHLEAGVKCIEELRHYVSLMSYNNLRDIKEMELNRLLRFIAGHSTIYHFVLDDINRIISAQLWHDTNLTVKYYFDLIYHWLGQYRLVYKQTKLINMPKEKLLLEKQITIIAQYFQPHVSYSIIDTWLNDIAQEVLSRLKNKYPTHSAFSTSSEQFTLWRDNNINDNFWNPTEAKQIMCILEEIIFSDLGVHQICQLLVTLDVEEKFIYYYNLLGCRECLLSIAYHSIARRLGLHCFVTATFLRYEYHFAMAILWGPKYYTEGCQSVEYFYMTKYPSDDSDIDRGICRVMCPLDPLYNISQIRNLIYNLCKLKYNYPLWFDLQVKHQVSYKWKMILKFLSHSLSDDIEDMHMDYEYTYITRLIKDRFNIVINDQPEIRKKEIKFTIGMIVTHRKSLCCPFVECNMDDGVIIGWHYKCKAAFVCKNLNSLIPYLMNVCYIIQRRRRSRRYQIRKYNCRFICQPHYIILTDHNKLCYVPQDAVSICPPRRINNVEIGRYFSKFESTYYVPNENLARNYPNDIAVMHEIFSNQ